jgi:hypothetical protein
MTLSAHAACTSPSPLPSGFAVPCPVFSLSANSVPQSGSLTLSATPQAGTDYIYTTAYYAAGSQWLPVTLTGNNAAPSYSTGLAQGTFSASILSNLPLGTNYVVLWDWLWDGTAQCYKGPGLNQCNTGQWRIQSFTITSNATPTPVPYAYSQAAYVTGGQPWSGILVPSRAIDWSKAGVQGGIPTNYTQCGSTIAAYSGTAATINSALAACGANHYVLLGAGTFNLSTGIKWSVNNVVLRGSSPAQTKLVFTGHDSCGGLSGSICMIGTTTNYTGGPSNVANWTAGYSAGTTSITLSANTQGSVAPYVGATLILDQLDTGTTRSADNGNIFICSTGNGQCTQSSGGNGRSGRAQEQLVTITSVSGNGPYTVGITAGLNLPNWNSGQTPQAWWSNGPYVTGIGVENLSVDSSGDLPGLSSVITLYNAKNSWVKNVSIPLYLANPQSGTVKHVELYQSSHVTVRDSYFHGRASVDEYGLGCWDCGDNLVENNIFHYVPVPMNNENGYGNVFGYNFTINNFWGNPGGTWAQGSVYGHGSHEDFILAEGNIGHGLEFENYFGHWLFITAFRNRFTGFETGNQNQTVPIFVYGLNRYENIVGNVLGVAGYHNTYQTIANSSVANCQTSIYAIGLGDNCNNGNGTSKPVDDPAAVNTLMRWGNYDTVNAANRFVNSEVPSGISQYSNPVPTSNSLPASFYLSSKPAWFGSTPWPPIGPDVTGGNLAGVGGHAYKNPAQFCYESIGGLADGTGPLLANFDAKSCYP